MWFLVCWKMAHRAHLHQRQKAERKENQHRLLLLLYLIFQCILFSGTIGSLGHTLSSVTRCGCSLHLPLRPLLTICGLWRIWKLLPVSKINSFKSRAQEATNHLFHQAWLIFKCFNYFPLKLCLFFPLFFFFFFSPLFEQESKTQRPTPTLVLLGHGSNSSGDCAVWMWVGHSALWNALPDPGNKISKASWDVSQSTLASVESGAAFVSESWIEKRRKRQGEEKNPKQPLYKLKLNVVQFLSSTPTE